MSLSFSFSFSRPPFEPTWSVMVPSVRKVDGALPDDVEKAVFLGEAARPEARAEILQMLGFADAAEWFSQHGLDKRHETQGNAPVGFDPEAQILAKLCLEDRYRSFCHLGTVVASRPNSLRSDSTVWGFVLRDLTRASAEKIRCAFRGERRRCRVS